MKNAKIILIFALTLVPVFFLVSCTTSNYGLKPTQVAEQKDTYKFKIYVGGFSGGETADNAVKPDLASYQVSNGYKDYKIIDRRYNLIPSYFEYTVHFIPQ